MSIFKTAKYIYALSLDETLSLLEEQGADLDTINFIKNSEQSIKPLYVKYLKENPFAKKEDLQNNVKTSQQLQRLNNHNEINFANEFSEPFKSWTLFQLRKQKRDNSDKYLIEGDLFDLDELFDSYKKIYEWATYKKYENSHFAITNFTFEEALNISDIWLQAKNGHGQGQVYVPLQRDKNGEIIDPKVLHIFEDGWFVVLLDNENDLLAEGKRLNHCVGDDKSYLRGVKNNTIQILSIRNSYNKPQATIEISWPDKRILQVRGFSDQTPDVETREHLIEFFKNYSAEFTHEISTSSLIDDTDWGNIDFEDLPEEIDRILNNPEEINDSDAAWYDMETITTINCNPDDLGTIYDEVVLKIKEMNDDFDLQEQLQNLESIAEILAKEAIYMDMHNSKHDIPFDKLPNETTNKKLSIDESKELAQQLNVPYETAWWWLGKNKETIFNDISAVMFLIETVKMSNQDIADEYGFESNLGVPIYRFNYEIIKSLKHEVVQTNYLEWYKKITGKEQIKWPLMSEFLQQPLLENSFDPPILSTKDERYNVYYHDENYDNDPWHYIKMSSIKKLIRISNILDSRGYYLQASDLDDQILKIAKSRQKSKKNKWSIKYKKSINCNNPKGFSQKQYCKRQKRGGDYKS